MSAEAISTCLYVALALSVLWLLLNVAAIIVRRGFSLLALLIVTTLVAATLGLIVYCSWLDVQGVDRKLRRQNCVIHFRAVRRRIPGV